MNRTAATGLLAMAALALGASACGRSGTVGDGQSEHGVRVAVAALTFEEVGDVVYTLTVKNGLGQTVWTRGGISSTRFGNGRGAISYVGPCDAQENPNSVELLITDVIDATSAVLSHPADYFNPTVGAGGEPTPLVVGGLTCIENGDVPVTFSITLMRSADQGFFDVAVNFDDIFCSAKLDCLPEFLHNDEFRAETVNIAFACTSGQTRDGAAEPTQMYMSPIYLRCVDDTTDPPTVTEETLDVFPGTEGNQGARPPLLFQWAQYFGQEGFSSYDKCYWNFALGLQMAQIGTQTCSLRAYGTASSTLFTGTTAPPGSVYPFVAWEVDVVTAGTLCAPQPLNGPGSGVVTRYERPELPPTEYAAAFTCDGAPQILPADAALSCGTTMDAWSRDGGTALAVTIGGVTSNTAPLPEGWTVADTCCSTACCR